MKFGPNDKLEINNKLLLHPNTKISVCKNIPIINPEKSTLTLLAASYTGTKTAVQASSIFAGNNHPFIFVGVSHDLKDLVTLYVAIFVEYSSCKGMSAAAQGTGLMRL